jgi:hypothetical protein
MPNGRCKVHGGKSTGPRTPEGLERSRRANWKHGHFSHEAKAERSRMRAATLALRYLRMLGRLTAAKALRLRRRAGYRIVSASRRSAGALSTGPRTPGRRRSDGGGMVKNEQ